MKIRAISKKHKFYFYFGLGRLEAKTGIISATRDSKYHLLFTDTDGNIPLYKIVNAIENLQQKFNINYSLILKTKNGYHIYHLKRVPWRKWIEINAAFPYTDLKWLGNCVLNGFGTLRVGDEIKPITAVYQKNKNPEKIFVKNLNFIKFYRTKGKEWICQLPIF